MSEYVSLQEPTQLIEEKDKESYLMKIEEEGQKMIDFLNTVVFDEETFGFLMKPGTDMHSNEQLIKKFVEFIFDKIPDFLKSESFPNKETLLDHCLKEKPENNMFNLVMGSLQAYLNNIVKNANDVEMHLLSPWGITGSGKSTLIKILASTFNSINPDDEDIANIKIDSNKVGTEKVSDIIKFNIGTYKMGALDAPGTEDISEDRTYTKILQQIKNKKIKLNNLLNVIDILESHRNHRGDKNTLEALAIAYKDIGLEFWDKVIVCLTKINDLTFEENQKPEFSNDFSDEELSEYITEYKQYIEKYNELLEKRIDAAKEHYKENWKKLFIGSPGKDPILKNIPENEKEEVFNRINFVVCGNVIQCKASKNTSNPYKKGTVKSIPHFEEIPLNPCVSEENRVRIIELNTKIKKGDYVLYRNWVNTLFNKIIQSSSLGFQINCANLNAEAVNRRENADNELQQNVQEDRRPGRKLEDVKLEEETTHSMRVKFKEHTEPKKSQKQKQKKTSNYQDGVTSFAGAVLGGASTFAAAATAWWIVAGLVVGTGGGYVTSKSVSYLSGGNWF